MTYLPKGINDVLESADIYARGRRLEQSAPPTSKDLSGLSSARHELTSEPNLDVLWTDHLREQHLLVLIQIHQLVRQPLSEAGEDLLPSLGGLLAVLG